MRVANTIDARLRFGLAGGCPIKTVPQRTFSALQLA
jgi:hypothetical protein